jgi:type VI secretion system secreted protein Hcp
MATNMMFLALRGGGKLLIEGESLDDVHPNEIVLVDWDWILENKAPITLKESDATKQASSKPLTLHKKFDKASPGLAKYCALGRHIPEGTVTIRKHDGDQMHEFLTIELRGIKVESVTWGAGRGDDASGIPETITLTFDKFSILYTMQSNEGPLTGGPSIFNFDVGQHKEE